MERELPAKTGKFRLNWSHRVRLLGRISASLRVKLLLIFAVLTILPLAIVGVVSYSKSFSTMAENTKKSATQITLQLNKNIELMFKESEKFLKIGNHDTTIRFLNPYRQTEEKTYRSALEIIRLFKLFREIYEFDTYIKGIYIIGISGNNISERVGRYMLHKDFGSIETIAKILKNPGKIRYIPNSVADYGDEAPDNPEGDGSMNNGGGKHADVISVGKAIIRPATWDVMGVIILDVDRNALMDLCRSVTMGNTGYFSLLTDEGEFIYPEKKPADIEQILPENVRLVGDTREGSFTQKVNGEPEFFVFNTLADSGWKIVGRVKLKELMRGAYQIRSITVAVVLICIIFTIIMYFFISDVLTHPIRDLKEQMKLAESGNLEVRAQCTNHDEIADLYHSFNAVLSQKESETLFGIIKGLKENGISIIFISHRLEEVLALSDRITVLRDGEHVCTLDNDGKSITRDDLIRHMVGRVLQDYFPVRNARIGEILLKVENLSQGRLFQNINFELRRGEFLGFYGLIGSGRTEIMKAVFCTLEHERGDILLSGKKTDIKTVSQAKNAGLALVPEDRKREGLVLSLSIGDNICLPNLDTIQRVGTVIMKKKSRLMDYYIEALSIRPALANRSAREYSGGNQQKAVIAKWLATKPSIIIFDEPTRGIDVGAKAEIYHLIEKLSEEGVGIVFVSSELMEVLGMCDRIMVVHEGRITGEFTKAEATQEKLMQAAAGF